MKWNYEWTVCQLVSQTSRLGGGGEIRGVRLNPPTELLRSTLQLRVALKDRDDS